MVFDHFHGCVRGEWPHESPTDIFGYILEDNQMPKYRSYCKLAPFTAGGYYPEKIAQVYNFPRASGHGQKIAIISLGGGVTQANVSALFAMYGQPTPDVSVVLVDGATNSPDGPNGADGENYLDIAMTGGIAPGAKIIVYLAPNTEQGFIDAFQKAIDDNVDIITCSWGAPEDATGTASMQAMNAVLQQAIVKRISVFAAAGDNGSGDGEAGRHVDFPASDPCVMGCGGTALFTSGNTITQEHVWNDGTAGGSTGGGVSGYWPSPAFQHTVSPSYRSVPDVAGNADPNTGYALLVDGQKMIIGGTSAVAPLWAGLTARLNQLLGKRLGFFAPTLYQHNGRGCRDITTGNNGAFVAKTGYDSCTGWGSPHGTVLLTLFSGAVAPPAPAETVKDFDTVMDALAKAHENDPVATPLIQRVRQLGDELIIAMNFGQPMSAATRPLIL